MAQPLQNTGAQPRENRAAQPLQNTGAQPRENRAAQPTAMSSASPLVARWTRPITETTEALVVALHGRGADETSLDFLPTVLDTRLAVASLRAPIAEGSGYARFANRGIGRPLPESIAATIELVTGWLSGQPELPVLLFGFSGGAAMAGGLLLADPSRYRGAALLAGTIPFESGLPADAGRLHGVPVLFARGAEDSVIPLDLIARTQQYLRGESGAALTEHSYPGLGHSVDNRMAADLTAWFGERLGELSSR